MNASVIVFVIGFSLISWFIFFWVWSVFCDKPRNKPDKVLEEIESIAFDTSGAGAEHKMNLIRNVLRTRK